MSGGRIKETAATGMAAAPVASMESENAITLTFLSVVDVPGYGVYRRGDVATMERAVAKQLLEVGRGDDDRRERIVRRYKEGVELSEPKRAHSRI